MMSAQRFYHGTSSVYLDSIRETGLGAVNPNQRYRLLDLLSHLLHSFEAAFPDDISTLQFRRFARAMANQSQFDEVFNGRTHVLNFRNNNTYVAFHPSRAMRYAAINRFGSEVLTNCVTLHELLRSRGWQDEIPQDLNTIELDSIQTQSSFPVFIEVDSIRPEMLLDEYGGSGVKKLRQIEKLRLAISEEDFFRESQLWNFELLRPIPYELLKIHRLIVGGDPRSPQARFTLGERH